MADERPAGEPPSALNSPPESLARRLSEVLGDVPPPGTRDLHGDPNVYLDAAAELFGELLHEGLGSRDGALDLLTVDALVTYAFESAADRPEEVAERARLAMVRFAQAAGQ